MSDKAIKNVATNPAPEQSCGLLAGRDRLHPDTLAQVCEMLGEKKPECAADPAPADATAKTPA